MKKIILLASLMALVSCKKQDIKGIVIGKDVKAGLQYTHFMEISGTTVPIVSRVETEWILVVKDSTFHKVEVGRDTWERAQIGDSLFRLNKIVYVTPKKQ